MLRRDPSRARNLASPFPPGRARRADPDPPFPLHPDVEPAYEAPRAGSRGMGTQRFEADIVSAVGGGGPPQPSADYPEVGDPDLVLATGHVHFLCPHQNFS